MPSIFGAARPNRFTKLLNDQSANKGIRVVQGFFEAGGKALGKPHLLSGRTKSHGQGMCDHPSSSTSSSSSSSSTTELSSKRSCYHITRPKNVWLPVIIDNSIKMGESYGNGWNQIKNLTCNDYRCELNRPSWPTLYLEGQLRSLIAIKDMFYFDTLSTLYNIVLYLFVES